MDQWPRLFHNLRASRETELAADHPIHVVTAWLGNTPVIAMKHYLQVTDADFDKAASNAAHFPAQPVQADTCRNQPDAAQAEAGQALLSVTADVCGLWQTPEMEDRGLEPLTF